ncbi:hypothetical protein Barb6_01914 [Bacteroidales bacterium Barb6]|nr:hypothetical protein Barb6_01914 [Bacteroidales bacterium Barb6]
MLMRRRIVLAGLCLACVFQTMEAETVDVTVNGIIYTLNLTGNTAGIAKNHNQFYSGDSALVIQAEITYGTQKFAVTEIGDNAFYSIPRIKSVTIPNSVTSIGEGAFGNCTSLASVTIPNSITSIGDWAFYNCRPLTSVTIPNSVTSIGKFTFSSCVSLIYVTIPNGVTSINDNAFEDCASLTFVTIPNSVTSIGKYAFGLCPSLTSITIPNSVTGIDDHAFRSCLNLQDIYLKWDDPAVCTLGSGVFQNVPTYCKVHIPKGSEEKYGWESNAANAKWQGFSIVPNFPIAKSFVTTLTNDSTMGYVTGRNINDSIAYDTEVTLIANPVDGHHFVEWTDADGNSLSAANPYIFNVAGDVTIQAHFAINSYRVDLLAENGTITSDDSTYTHGAEAKVEAFPNTGYHFVKWTNAKGDSLSADNPYTFIVKSDTTIRAHFTLSYRVKLSARNGTIISGDSVYAYGAEAKAEVSPNKNYYFVKWTDENGDSLSAANPYMFIVKRNMTLTAVFAMNVGDFIIVDAAEGGQAIGSGYYGYGTLVAMEAIPDSGYVFTGWKSGDNFKTLITANKKFHFVMTEKVFNAYRAYFAKGSTGSSKVSGSEAKAYYAEGTLHLVNLEGSDISVHTIDGRQILQFKANNTEHSAALPAGIYILDATGGKGRHVAKFVVKE